MVCAVAAEIQPSALTRRVAAEKRMMNWNFAPAGIGLNWRVEEGVVVERVFGCESGRFRNAQGVN